LFHALSLTVIAGLIVAGVLTFLNSDNSTEALAAADAQRELAVQQCVDGNRFGGQSQDFPQAPEGSDPRAFCEKEVWVESPAFDYSELQWIQMSMGVPIIMLAWLLGASFMGAEWSNRTLTSTFTWDPRRVRVLAAKAGALVVASFFWVLLLQAFLAAALAPAGFFRGVSGGLEAGFWGDVSGTALRVAGLAVIAALMGFSLATIGKNTAAALGVGFVQLAIVEGLIRGLKPSWSDWLIGDNLGLFLAGAEDVVHLGHSQVGAGVLLATYAFLLLAVAAAILRRREMA
jgi:hypothetical protein